MVFCQGCGAGNAEDARFCNQCGAKIARSGEPGGPLPTQAAGDPQTTMHGHGGPDASGGEPPPQAEEPSPEARTDVREPTPAPWQVSSLPPAQHFDVSTVSLSAIGVRSRGKAWGVIVGVALALVALGAGGMWIAMRPSAPEPSAQQTEEPDPEGPIEIGDPVPEGQEEVDVITGTPRPASPRTPRERAERSARRPSDPRPREPSASRTASAARTGERVTSERTTGGRPSTGGASTGSASTGGGSTGGASTGEGGSTGTAEDPAGSGEQAGAPPASGREPDWEALEEAEQDPMDEYATRTRNFIRTYYARRAQSCFEHETRNERSVRGTVVIGFQIQADGNVDRAQVVRNTTGLDSLGRCLATQVNAWRLPQPPEAPLAMQMPFSR